MDADLYLTVTLFLYATEDTCHIANKHAHARTIENIYGERDACATLVEITTWSFETQSIE